MGTFLAGIDGQEYNEQNIKWVWQLIEETAGVHS